MQICVKIIVMILFIFSNIIAQGLNPPSKGFQTFDMKDSTGRNQAIFISNAPYEDMTGLANNVWGKVSFDMKDIKSTLKAEVSVSVSSLKTGIEKRDEHLQGALWLNAEKYPLMTFHLKEILSFTFIEDNEIKLSLLGHFTLRGHTKIVYAYATMKYLAKNEITETIMPGDLLSIVAKFEINLSDFGIYNSFVGNRVSDKISITANLIGSNRN